MQDFGVLNLGEVFFLALGDTTWFSANILGSIEVEHIMLMVQGGP